MLPAPPRANRAGGTGEMTRRQAMAKIQITKTELVWPGKYREDGVLASRRGPIYPFRWLRFSTNPAHAEAVGRTSSYGVTTCSSWARCSKSLREDRPHLHRPALCHGDRFLLHAQLGAGQLAIVDPGETLSGYLEARVGAYLAMMAERLRLIRDLLVSQREPLPALRLARGPPAALDRR